MQETGTPSQGAREPRPACRLVRRAQTARRRRYSAEHVLNASTVSDTAGCASVMTTMDVTC